LIESDVGALISTTSGVVTSFTMLRDRLAGFFAALDLPLPAFPVAALEVAALLAGFAAPAGACFFCGLVFFTPADVFAAEGFAVLAAFFFAVLAFAALFAFFASAAFFVPFLAATAFGAARLAEAFLAGATFSAPLRAGAAFAAADVFAPGFFVAALVASAFFAGAGLAAAALAPDDLVAEVLVADDLPAAAFVAEVFALVVLTPVVLAPVVLDAGLRAAAFGAAGFFGAAFRVAARTASACVRGLGEAETVLVSPRPASLVLSVVMTDLLEGFEGSVISLAQADGHQAGGILQRNGILPCGDQRRYQAVRKSSGISMSLSSFAAGRHSCVPASRCASCGVHSA
jgi:hypothetical protein